MVAKIEVTGLREFQKQLKQMDDSLPKELRLGLNKASQIVIDYASSHMPSRTGKARASLKGRSSQKVVRIGLGGRRAPYAPWLDFGGEGKRKGRPAYREFRKDGRYVYKGLEVKRDEVLETMSVVLTQLAKSAGLEVT